MSPLPKIRVKLPASPPPGPKTTLIICPGCRQIRIRGRDGKEIPIEAVAIYHCEKCAPWREFKRRKK